MAQLDPEQLSQKIKELTQSLRDARAELSEFKKAATAGSSVADVKADIAKLETLKTKVKELRTELERTKGAKINLNIKEQQQEVSAFDKKIRDLNAAIKAQLDIMNKLDAQKALTPREDKAEYAKLEQELRKATQEYLKFYNAREKVKIQKMTPTALMLKQYGEEQGVIEMTKNKKARGVEIGPTKFGVVQNYNQDLKEMSERSLQLDARIRRINTLIAQGSNKSPSITAGLVSELEMLQGELDSTIQKMMKVMNFKQDYIKSTKVRLTPKEYEGTLPGRDKNENSLLDLQKLSERAIIAGTNIERTRVELSKMATTDPGYKKKSDELEKFILIEKEAHAEMEKMLKDNAELKAAWGSFVPPTRATVTKAAVQNVEPVKNLKTTTSLKQEIEKEISGGDIGTAVSNKITADLMKQAEAYKKLGVTIDGVRTIKTEMVNGSIKVNGFFTSEMNTVKRISSSYDMLGNSIDKVTKSSRSLTAEQQKAISERFPEANAKVQAIDPRFKLKKASYNTAGVGSGVTKLDYAFTDEMGVLNKTTAVVDRYGQTLMNTSKSTRSFAQGVARDTVEMLKWSMAMSIIYVPLQKFNEMMQIMIKNEALLADVAVTVSNAHITVGEIFTTVADAANAAGESITGVIEGFTLAYRATGNLGNAEERMAVASKLMNDAMILAKISTLSQAAAIDTLAASLRQTGMGLDQGMVLLDKWVKTTKIANVDLATLATGFAVLGDSADAAGLSIDELNGLMAAIAETGIASSAEAANQARAIVSGFQSDNASKELMKYGISVKTVTGELRPFMDVMQQIYNMKEAGILGNEEIGKITLALGGGTRRQAVYSAFLENFNRVKEVAEESAQAEGDAMGAMAKELDTVQTAITRLGNSFQSLAQSLGESGGLLDLFKNILNLVTGIVNIFDKLTGSIGKAAPMLYALGIATAVFRGQSSGKQAATLSSINKAMAWLPNKIAGERYEQAYIKPGFTAAGKNPSTGELQYRNTQTGYFAGKEQALRPSSGMQAASNIMSGTMKANLGLGIASIIPGIIAESYSTDEDKWAKVGLGIAGAAVGFLLAQGNPIGAIIGQSAGTAIVNAISEFGKYDFGGYVPYDVRNKPTNEGGTGGATPNKTAEEKRIEELKANAEVELLKSFAKNTFAFSFGPKFAAEDAKIYAESAKTEAGRKRLRKSGLNIPEGGDELTYFDIVYLNATPEAREKYKKALDELNIAKGIKTAPGTFELAAFDTKKRNEKLVADLQAQQKTTYVEQLTTGELTPGKYTEGVQDLTNLATQASLFTQALGPALKKTNERFKTDAELYRAYLELRVNGSQEDIANVSAYVSEIQDLYTKLDAAKKMTEGEKGVTEALFGEVDAMGISDPFEGTREEIVAYIEKKLDEVLGTGTPVVNAILEDVRYRELIKNVPSTGPTVATQADAQLIYERAKKIDEQRMAAGGVTGKDLETYRSLLEDFFVVIEEGAAKGGDAMFKAISEFGVKVSSEAFGMATEQLKEEKKLTDTSVLGFQSYDITKAQFDKAMQGYTPLKSKLEGFGYKPEETDLIQIFKGGDTVTNKKDWAIVQYLLQRMVDLNQEQLDGMYNIPDGANFWIPYNDQLLAMLTAYATGGNGDTGVVDAIDNSADRIVNAIEKLTPAEYDTMQIEKLKQQGYGKLGTESQQNPAYTAESVAARKSANIGGHGVAGSGTGIINQQPTTGYKVDENGVLIEQAGQKYSGQNVGTINSSVNDWEATRKFLENYQKSSSTPEAIGTLGGIGEVGTKIVEAIKAALAGLLAPPQPYEPRNPFDETNPFGAGAQKLQQQALPNMGMFGILSNILSSQKMDVAPQTKLDIKMDSTVQLVVDGRTLASIVKTYLMADLIKAQSGFGTRTQSIVITQA